MTKNKFVTKLSEYGDAFALTYKNGKEAEFLITMDLDLQYIKDRVRKLKEIKGTIPIWNWSLDTLEYIDPKKVKSLSPLSSILNNEEKETVNEVDS
jgi:hypothetical protein